MMPSSFNEKLRKAIIDTFKNEYPYLKVDAFAVITQDASNYPAGNIQIEINVIRDGAPEPSDQWDPDTGWDPVHRCHLFKVMPASEIKVPSYMANTISNLFGDEND